MSEIVTTFEHLVGCDLSASDRADLDLRVRESSKVRAWLDAFDLRVAHRNRELTGAGREANANLLSNNGRRSGRASRTAADRAETAAAMPDLAEALEQGECTADHVDAVTRATAGCDDQTRERVAGCGAAIAAAAKTRTPEQLEREVRDLARNCSDDDGLSEHERRRRQRCVKRWVNRETGMHVTALELDAETDAKVQAALRANLARLRNHNQHDDDRTFDQLQADALVDLIVNGNTGDGTLARPEATVLIDWQTLVGGVHPSTVCETGDGVALPVDTVRRLCCDADVLPVVLNGAGVVLDEGRAQRTATREQRRALRAMYRHCAFTGCTVGFDQCRIHHVIYWWNHGTTDLDNLLPLCEQHHHAVHEGGWTLQLQPGPGRPMHLVDPEGRVAYHGPSVTRTPAATIPTPCSDVNPATDQSSTEPAHTGTDVDDPTPNLFDSDTDDTDGSARTQPAQAEPTTPNGAPDVTDLTDVIDAVEAELAGMSDRDLLDAVSRLLHEHEHGHDAHVDGAHAFEGLCDAVPVAVARAALDTTRGGTGSLPAALADELRAIHRRRRQRSPSRHRQPQPV